MTFVLVLLSLVAGALAQTSLSCNAWVNIEESTPKLNVTATGTAIVVSNSTGTFFFLNGAQVRDSAGGILNTSVIAHVYTQPCASGAGSHFKFNTSIATATKSNELWASPINTSELAPQGTSTWSGASFLLGALNDSRKAELASVVILSGTPKLVCCNLVAEVTTSGSTSSTSITSSTSGSTVVSTNSTVSTGSTGSTGSTSLTTSTNSTSSFTATTNATSSITAATNATSSITATLITNSTSSTTSAPVTTSGIVSSSTALPTTSSATVNATSIADTANTTSIDASSSSSVSSGSTVPACTTADCCAAYDAELSKPCSECLTNSGCTYYAVFNNDVVQSGGQCLLKTAEAPSLRRQVNATTECADYCSSRTCEDCINTSSETGCVWCDTVKATTGLSGNPTCESKKCTFNSKPWTNSNVCSDSSIAAASIVAVLSATFAVVSLF